ncbi:polyketide cyclase [Sphingomonas sp. Leaf412]|uniref:nuclear transport factor 2 family protein n=1 Tax=Sphingomonas sp. Leaf412 TaxID=1736370 RepID=UPI0006FBC409|nr:nuclear transport factor 2 family protein [Sphingomonas sp. Leaf412]KQT32429.1 polyketide cyclase [Sphingomonas sp. Leaf412]
MADVVERWHAYMHAPTREGLAALLADDVIFQSPAVHTPQEGKAVTLKYLWAAADVLGGPTFRYVGEWRNDTSAVLEFECELEGGIKVNGVDIIHWRDDGLISRFKVMVRPMKGLNAVVPLMGAVLAKE